MNCPTCGLPQELCVCASIAKEGGQKVVVRVVKRKFGSPTTVIEGIDKSNDLKAIAKQLKEKLACGGTVKADAIELMGDHRKKAKEMLVSLGFPADGIEVKQQIE